MSHRTHTARHPQTGRFVPADQRRPLGVPTTANAPAQPATTRGGPLRAATGQRRPLGVPTTPNAPAQPPPTRGGPMRAGNQVFRSTSRGS